MATANDVLRVARAELGYKEYPSGSNKTKYGKEYGMNGVAWCAEFVWWVFRHAGCPSLFYGGGKCAYCPTIADYYIARKQTVSKSSGRGGDIVLFGFGHTNSQHIGIIECKNSDGTYTCIEGNTATGNNCNGGMVMRRKRYQSQINWIVRPKYAEDKPLPKPTTKYTGTIPTGLLKRGSKGDKVKQLQNFLNWYGAKCGTADGEFGSNTESGVMAFQRTEGLVVDGEYGDKSYAKAKLYKATTQPTPKGTKCIDSSYWQGKHSVEDWQKVGKTCSHVIHRASYTEQEKFSLNPDSTFETNLINSAMAGLKCGAYHYSQAITVDEAKKEATYFCNILDKYKDKITFYVVCDYEFGKRLSSKIGTKASEIANAFCDEVKARGYSPCIYANYTMLTKYLTNPKYPVWVAQYNSTCSYKKDKVLWQYTSSGSVDGISGKVDLSYVYAEPKPEPTTKPSKYGGEFPDLVVNCRNHLNKVAKDLAYAKGTSSKTYNYKTGKPKEAFTKAIKKVYGLSYSKWSKQCRMGASCDVFVGTVVRYSGCDTKYPRGLAEQVKTSPKHCTEVKDIKAGDIMRYGTKTGGHTRMIVDINGTLYNCEANHGYKGGQYGHISGKATAKPRTAVRNLKIFRCNSAFKSMSKGDKGSEVTKLQKFLKWAGFDCGTADGDFGDRTLGAVKNFQLKVGLTADGEFGSKSLVKAKEYTK